nr:glycosyltransferase [uncultured Acetobacter sp.]
MAVQMGQAEGATDGVEQARVAVIIPSYNVRDFILDVISRIGPDVSAIYMVDDCCPEKSGQYVTETCMDPRVHVLQHTINQGVGGAVLTGYQAALADNMDIMIKIDGDGQMDPALIPRFIAPILAGYADYTKGNRFFNPEDVASMPKVRLLGNAGLSFLTKFSSGYWSIFDPTNGYTAIHKDVATLLPFDKISRRYFFETDMLFRLNTVRAIVKDIPMRAHYGDEVSGLNIKKVFFEFFSKNIKNFFKRIFYNYYLRDMSISSFELPAGLFLILYGSFYGGLHWFYSFQRGIYASAGTVMLAALPIILGIQFLLAFLSYDIQSEPGRNGARSLRCLTQFPRSGTLP